MIGRAAYLLFDHVSISNAVPKVEQTSIDKFRFQGQRTETAKTQSPNHLSKVALAKTDKTPSHSNPLKLAMAPLDDQTVIVKDAGKSVGIPIDVRKGEKITSFTTVKQYFPNARGLVVLTGDVPRLLRILDGEGYILVEGVSEYTTYCKDGPVDQVSSAKKLRFDTMLADINKKTAPEPKLKPKLDTNIERVVKRGNQKRVATVSWKHRSHFSRPFKKMGTIGPTKKIELKFSVDYSLEHLIEILVKNYCTEDNKSIFQESLVELADPTKGEDHEEFIEKFCDKEGNECDFWTFQQLFLPRDSGHRLRLLFLSTQTCDSDDDEDEFGDDSKTEKSESSPRQDRIPLSAKYSRNNVEKNKIKKRRFNVSDDDEMMGTFHTEKSESSPRQDRIPLSAKYSQKNVGKKQVMKNLFNKSKPLSVPELQPTLNYPNQLQPFLKSSAALVNEKNENVAPAKMSAGSKNSKSRVGCQQKLANQVSESKRLLEENVENVVLEKMSPRSKYSKSRIVSDKIAVNQVSGLKSSSEKDEVNLVSKNLSPRSKYSKSRIFSQHNAAKRGSVSEQEKLKEKYSKRSLTSTIKDKHTPSQTSPLSSATSKKSVVLAGSFKVPQSIPKKDTFSTLGLSISERVENLRALNLKIPFINFDELEHIKDLGNGGQANVTQVKWMATDYAAKSYLIEKYESSIIQEIAALEKVRHPNIISIMGICVTRDHYHILTDVAEGQNLEILLQNSHYEKIDLETKDIIGEKITAALRYLHQRFESKPPIIHRDLKPANVIVNLKNLQVKVCDFGLCKMYDLPDKYASGADIIAGTQLYMSPNQLLDHKKATLKSDIWSLACTFVELYSVQDVWEISWRLSIIEQVKKHLLTKRTPETIFLPVFLSRTVKKCFD